jgi:hypothetical protein
MTTRRKTPCDICGRYTLRLATVYARTLSLRGTWGWYEGHLACIRAHRQRVNQPHKFGRVAWRGSRQIF